MKFPRLCVLGLGYIGLPTASTFATHGIQVVGVDVNHKVVSTLQTGNLHIQEPGLRTVVQAALQAGNLVIQSTVEPADGFIIAVPTPFYADKRADLSYVKAATASIVPHLRPGNLVILESTSPPRTTVDIVAPILEQSGLKAGKDFHLVYSPERVLPGHILRELVENARVIGGVDPASAEAGRELYSTFVRGEIILTDATTAEMVKLMENTSRDVNIAIANEFARLAERFGVDAWEAIRIANLHPRVRILNPGTGVGGHCIGVDPWFLVEAAPDLTTLIRSARQVNDSQPNFVFRMVQRVMGGMVKGKRIAALGLAYKPDVDDLRESPAIEVARLLSNAGAEVVAFEPFKPDFTHCNFRIADRLETALKDADLLLLLVAHSAFIGLDPFEAARLTTARLAVDTVNGWNHTLWHAAGFQYFRLGVGKPL
jgi:UDP-N-acetyl-D-mannosaminuronic acid dehydrogenase